MVGAPEGAENIMTDWLGLPALASAHGGQIDSLIGWVHVFMLILFVGWGGFFAYCLIRFRRSRHPVANYTGVKSHTSSYLEVGVAVVEAVLLFGFAIPLWAARVDRHARRRRRRWWSRSPASSSPGTSTTPGPDGVFGRTDIKLLDLQSNPLGLDRDDPAAKDDVTTLNQLYLPVNKPVIVRLRSKDVIHSFGVPEFRVKQDAIPGLTIPIWFVPTVTTAEMRTRTGKPEFQYEIACAQLCGLGHCPDARLRHRPDRRRVPEVDGREGREAERDRIPSVADDSPVAHTPGSCDGAAVASDAGIAQLASPARESGGELWTPGLLVTLARRALPCALGAVLLS